MYRSHRATRVGRAGRPAVVALLLLAFLVVLGPVDAGAQSAGEPAEAESAAAPTPPLTPKRAFLYSLALPGYSQSVLGRPKAAALFITAEAISLVMIKESSANLRTARRLQDSIPVSFVDPGTGSPRTIWAPGFSEDHIRSRQQQVEDWLAALAANHLFSAVDAFVAAHLWDVPLELAVRRGSRGATVAATFRW
jgi:hypothetical protein